MTYVEGSWGYRAKLRSQRRTKYFREYRRKHRPPYVYKYHKGNYKSYGTSLGYGGEMLALKVLVGSKRIMKPCDLSWNGKLVDVKTAKPSKPIRGKDRWKFLLTKQVKTANLFLLICKDAEDKVKAIYLVPNEGKKNITFNEVTAVKYQKYLLSL